MSSNAKITTLAAGLSELQLYLYKSIIKRDLEILNNETTVNDSTLLDTVIQLKHCCSHPYLFEGIEEEQTEKDKSQTLHVENPTIPHLIKNCGKLFVTDKLITKLISNNTNTQNKILLCSNIPKMFEWFAAYCNERGISNYNITNQNQSIPNCSILFHQTSNQDNFDNAMEYVSNVNTIIFYDTNWSVKDKEQYIMDTLMDKCDEKEELNVYKIYSKNTLEEKAINMEQKSELNTNELKSLIRYKATKMINISVKSTLNMEQNISDILENDCNIISDESDSEDDIIESKSKKYTMNDILNHPENQGTIRVFILVFCAMIIIPLISVMILNKYIWKYYLLDWTSQSKDNLTIIICVGIAHIIGIIYIIYAYSGEDRIPAHILDSKKDDEEDEEEESKENDIINKGSIINSLGHNGLRQRKTKATNE